MPHSNDRSPMARYLRRRGAPPDYSQRSIKTKIFVLLALLMLVLAVAERARDPQTWKWLAELEKGGPRAEKINNRLQPPPLRTAADDSGSFVSSNPAASAAGESKPSDQAADGIDPVHRAWRQGWKEVLQRLDDSQRTLLCEMLYVAAQHQPLPPDKLDAAATAVETANHLWEDYQAAAFQSLVTLSPDDQVQWVEVLRQVNARWSNDVRPSLGTVLDGRTPTENEEILLARFQQTIDELTLLRIEDDTLFLRPAEREIWLRLQGRARDTDPARLRQESLGQVGYLQLFKQPGEYRGRPVSVRGTVKHAYRVAASENYLGIKEHFVLWLMPDGGPTSPIVVYALDMPPGFPEIKPSGDGDLLKLHEDVSVTGFFLKRGAYLGKDGTYTAPLILANVPQWNRRDVTLTDTARFSFGPAWLVPSIIASLAVSAVLIGLAWWWLRRSEAQSRAALASAAGQHVDFGQLTLGASTHEALRDLEEQARNEQ